MGKAKMPKSMAQSQEYKELLTKTTPLETLMMNLASLAVKNNISYDEMAATLDSVPLKVEKPFNSVLKEGWGEVLPESLLSTSSFSREEQAKRGELTKKAFMTYGMNTFSRQSVYTNIVEMAKNGVITEAEKQEISYSRDIASFYFKPAANEQVKEKNMKDMDYLLGRDLDKSKMSTADFQKIKDRRKAELINKNLEELINSDFSKYESMSDEELVENWPEYSNKCYLLATVRKEIYGNKQFRQCGVNQDYVKKCVAMEDKYNMVYMANFNKLLMVANPYYKEIDVNYPLKVPYMDYGEFEQIDDHVKPPHEMSRFLTASDGYRKSANVAAAESTLDFFMAKHPDTAAQDIAFYDVNGNPIDTTSEIISDITVNQAVYVVDMYHPETVMTFEYDAKTGNLKANEAFIDPETAQKIRTEQEKGLEKRTTERAQKRAADQKKADEKYFKENIEVGNITKLSTSLGREISSICTSISETDDPQKYKGMTIDYLKNLLANPTPKTGAKDFYDYFDIKPEDRLGQAEIDARREFSRVSIEKTVNARYAELEGRALPAGLRNAINKNTNYRQFTSFLFKPGKENLEHNKEVAMKYFGVDENGNDLHIDPEILKQNRQAIVDARLNDYVQMRDSIWNKTYDDKSICDNFEKLQEFGRGMGMEWKAFKRLAEADGVKFADPDMLSQLNEDAYTVNNSLNIRMDYICTDQYQYGNYQKICNGESFALGSAHPDNNVQRTVGRAFDVYSFAGTTLGTAALQSLGKDARVQYAYTASGDPVEVSESGLGMSMSDGNDVYVFVEGKKDPVVFQAQSIGSGEFGIPVTTSTKPLTPEMETQARIMRVNADLDKLKADSVGKLDPRNYVNVGTRYVMSRFNVAELAAGMNGLEGAKRDSQYKALRDSMCEYLVFETLIKSSAGMDLGIDSIREMTSDSKLRKYASEMGGSTAVDQLIDNMLKADPTGKNFDQMDPEKILKDFSNELKTAKKIEDTERLKEIETSKKTFENSKAVNKFATKAASKEFWGINSDITNKTAKATELKSLSLDRRSLQTIAFGKMLNDGYSVEQILTDTPEMAAKRKEASYFATKAVVQNDKETILNMLNSGRDKFNDYLGQTVSGLKQYTSSELLTPKNAYFVASMPFIKDFYQESNTILGYFDNPGQYKTPEFTESMSRNDAYGSVTFQITAGTQQVMEEFAKNDKTKTNSDRFDICFGKCLDEAINSACMKYYSNHPDNRGKDVTQFVNEDFMMNRGMMSMKLMTDPALKEFKDRVHTDPRFADKAISVLLDDSFVNKLNLKVQGFAKDDNGMIEPKYTMDVKNLIKQVERRDFNYAKQYEEAKRTKVQDPKQKANEMVKSSEAQQMSL